MLNAVRSFVANVRKATAAPTQTWPLYCVQYSPVPSCSVPLRPVQSVRYCAKLTNEPVERTRCGSVCCVSRRRRWTTCCLIAPPSPLSPLWMHGYLSIQESNSSVSGSAVCVSNSFCTLSFYWIPLQFHVSQARERNVRNVIIKGRLHAEPPRP